MLKGLSDCLHRLSTLLSPIPSKKGVSVVVVVVAAFHLAQRPLYADIYSLLRYGQEIYFSICVNINYGTVKPKIREGGRKVTKSGEKRRKEKQNTRLLGQAQHNVSVSVSASASLPVSVSVAVAGTDIISFHLYFMRCLSAFASFERYTHIDRHIHTDTNSNSLTDTFCEMGKRICCSILWQQLLFPAEGPSQRRQQSSINLATAQPSERASCILYLTDTHATCALSRAYRVFFTFFFVSFFFFAFAFHFALPSASACILWMRRSRQTVYKQQSWRLASPRLASRSDVLCATTLLRAAFVT